MARAALGHCISYLTAVREEAAGSCSQSIRGTGLWAIITGHGPVASIWVQAMGLTCLVEL